MAKCQLTGKGRTFGNKISHSNIKTRVSKLPNVQRRRIYDADSKKTITLYLSTNAIKTLDKMGLTAFVRKYGAADPKVARQLGV